MSRPFIINRIIRETHTRTDFTSILRCRYTGLISEENTLKREQNHGFVNNFYYRKLKYTAGNVSEKFKSNTYPIRNHERDCYYYNVVDTYRVGSYYVVFSLFRLPRYFSRPLQ